MNVEVCLFVWGDVYLACQENYDMEICICLQYDAESNVCILAAVSALLAVNVTHTCHVYIEKVQGIYIYITKMFHFCHITQSYILWFMFSEYICIWSLLFSSFLFQMPIRSLFLTFFPQRIANILLNHWWWEISIIKT